MDDREHPRGNQFVETFCNARSKKGDTTPVGSYLAESNSPYGVSDMSGNVWEWCADWFDGDYYRKSPARNPQGPNKGVHRAPRGDAWRNDESTVRIVARHGVAPDTLSNSVGFRCAK